MEAKKFKPAVESVTDIQWTIAATPDVWPHQDSVPSEAKKIISITKGDRRGNESIHPKEVEKINGMEVCNKIDLKLGEFEEMEEKGLLSTGKLSMNSMKVIQVKPHKTAVEVNPFKKTVEVIDIEHPNKSVEAFEAIPSETVEIIEAKTSKKAVEELERKSSEKTAKVIEVKSSNKYVDVLETLEQVNSYTCIGVVDKSDIECPISLSREGGKDHNNDIDMETVEDLFKKYIPEEYQDFLDSSLQIDTCSEFYNNLNDEKHVSPEEPLSKSISFPLIMSEECQGELNYKEETQKDFSVDLNIVSKKDLVDRKNSIINEQRDNCPPKSLVQTSSDTTQKAMTLSRNDLNEVSDDQPKRYSLRQRKNKGVKIYVDTDEWCDELDFNEEHTDKSQKKNLKDHQQTNHNLRKNENMYGQSKNHNGQNVIQQRYIQTDEAEESMEYKYKPRKRRSAQSHYCMACHMGFKSKGDLQMHKALSGCDDLYQCVVCFDFFSSIENLCIHGTIHNVFFCPICGRCYKTKPGLYQHQLDHTGSKPFSCDKCHSTYKTRSELVIHHMYHTGNVPFHCHTCLKGFPAQGQIKRHIDMHATYDTVTDLETCLESLQCRKCKKCGNVFKSEELLGSHEREHNDTQGVLDDGSVDNSQNYSNKLELDKLDIGNCDNLQLKADFVQQSLEPEEDSQSQIFDLTQSEESEDDFQMKKSGVHRLEEHEDTFQSQSDVNQAKEHGDDIQSQVSGEIQRDEHVENSDCNKPFYKCTQCSRIFESHMAYLYHKLIHKRDALEKLYKCDKCPMIFYLESSLVSHQLIHREPRPTICDTCGKTFSNQLDLVYHRAVHNAEKGSLKCSKCPKVFQLVKQLARHAETHFKDRKQFPCKICNKMFKTRSGLARHNMDHTGERRYSCSMCTKKFKTSTQLRCHVAVHTGIRPYHCKICGKGFPIKSYLTSHSMIHK